MPERPYNDRVDDTILVGSLRLSRQRDRTIRQMIDGHREACFENLRDSADTDMDGYWRNRIDRCNAVLEDSDDLSLRRRAVAALDREMRS